MKYIIVLLACLMLTGHAGAQKHIVKDTAVVITVYGRCEQCKQRIETAAKGKGVVSANWDIESKKLSLVYNPGKTMLDKIQQRILLAGHDTEFKQAADDAYNSLPACCLYRSDKDAAALDDSLHSTTPGTGQKVKGVVMQMDSKGNFAPLEGASVYWLTGALGVLTDTNGTFAIAPGIKNDRLVISYAGYAPDTVTVNNAQQLKVIMAAGSRLKDVTVYSGNRAYYASSLTAVRTQVIGEKELFKAACCNLSESFETNPSVDVSYNDAVTGTKQIQLLGLSGTYTQLTVENMPGPGGIATPVGLSLIPGTWIESIQLTKGAGSVVNGFESIAGQINIEEKKPQTAEKVLLNAYVNEAGKTDINFNLTHKVSKYWSTALLVHDDFMANRYMDENHDNFRDLPTGNQLNIQNRWQYTNEKGLMAQAGIKVLADNRTGGQVGFNPLTDKLTTQAYGIGLATQRYEAFGKIGYVFPGKKYKSIGLQLSTYRHTQDDYFGLVTYNAKQQNMYANLIYQSIIGNTNHKFRTGLSFQYDHYNETVNAGKYTRTEMVPGIFFEYTWEPSTKFNMIAGVRADHNNLYGGFVTPRLNARYQPFKNTTIRLSGGRGQRTANIFAENLGWFASSRAINIIGSTGKGAYGLQPEIAWNEGISIDQKFRLFGRDGNVAADFFRTDFVRQVVADADKSASAIYFYNLQGKSYSNSLQAEVNYALLKHLDLRLAYRLFDVKTSYHGELLARPLVAKQRAFASIHYETNSLWKFDYTVQATGQKRLPYSGDNPAEYQWQSYSPAYVVMNVQVSKTYKQWDVYIGAEDLNNFYQKQLIIDAANPFSRYFDAAVVWGPTLGRMFYAGMRFKIK